MPAEDRRSTTVPRNQPLVARCVCMLLCYRDDAGLKVQHLNMMPQHKDEARVLTLQPQDIIYQYCMYKYTFSVFWCHQLRNFYCKMALN